MTRPGTRSKLLERCGASVGVAAIVALSCVGSTALANVRAAADVGLIEVSPAWLSYYPFADLWVGWGWPGRTQIARLELGAEVTDNVGITAGAMLVEAWGEGGAFYAASSLPITARVYWDFTPNDLWVRSTAYFSATYYRSYSYGDPDMPASGPCVVPAVGAAYTYYAFTVRAELQVSTERVSGAVLSLGIEVGGSYIFGSHDTPDLEY